MDNRSLRRYFILNRLFFHFILLLFSDRTVHRMHWNRKQPNLCTTTKWPRTRFKCRVHRTAPSSCKLSRYPISKIYKKQKLHKICIVFFNLIRFSFTTTIDVVSKCEQILRITSICPAALVFSQFFYFLYFFFYFWLHELHFFMVFWTLKIYFTLFCWLPCAHSTEHLLNVASKAK